MPVSVEMLGNVAGIELRVESEAEAVSVTGNGDRKQTARLWVFETFSVMQVLLEQLKQGCRRRFLE